ncbi:hypothetical protein BHE74_00033127 [Ensete ventricosum]|nr:hypothetical protein GW17_00049375 [Ensete ventricosum]RWW59909.1 hypothetical protein BHE74_00033127 [Ensete ventricosum]RZS05944.1 hypothetical protein BHM03_00036518 [Ensete ventricosum]
MGVPSSKVFLKGCIKDSSINDKKWRVIRLFIDPLTLIPKRTHTSRLLPLSNS